MGGRGSFSYSGGGRRADSAPLGSYAVAGLNSGTAKDGGNIIYEPRELSPFADMLSQFK